MPLSYTLYSRRHSDSILDRIETALYKAGVANDQVEIDLDPNQTNFAYNVQVPSRKSLVKLRRALGPALRRLEAN